MGCHQLIPAFGFFVVLLCSWALTCDGSRSTDEDVVRTVHPGHSAVHVTRLHRYDHSGLAAMLQAEARWQQRESPETREQAVREEEKAGVATASADGSRKAFVQLSGRQIEFLEEHHQSVRESQRTVGSIQTHRSFHAAQAKSTDPTVTRLSSLDSQYVGPIGIGTVVSPQGCENLNTESLIYIPPGQVAQVEQCHAADQAQVWVVFDTGSTNIWVSSDLCQRGACVKPGRVRYNHLLSQTYTAPRTGMLLHIEFGTGSVSGPQAVDDLHIGPFTVYNQTFGMIQSEEGAVFDEVPFEGILGLAFPSMSARGVTPFFDSVIDQHVLRNNEFAFYFSLYNPSANAVFWGGVDDNFYTGQIEYFPVKEAYYWSLALRSFQIGGAELLGESLAVGNVMLQRVSPRAIIDTGTTYFTAESSIFGDIMMRLPSTPCDAMTEQTHPPILFQLENAAGELRDFKFNRMQYMYNNSDGICNPTFMQINLPANHGPGMILGEVFLKHYYSVFDRGNGRAEDARVGLAHAAHGEPVDDHLKAITQNQPAFGTTRGTLQADSV